MIADITIIRRMHMFRMWGHTVKDGHTVKSLTIEDPSDKNRTKKVFEALSAICLSFDLAQPQWLAGNIAEFKRISRTRFTADSFIEEISFDYLEIRIVEED